MVQVDYFRFARHSGGIGKVSGMAKISRLPLCFDLAHDRIHAAIAQ